MVKRVHESLGGDVEMIKEPVNRKGIMGWIRTGRQNAQRTVGDISPPQYDPSNYDLVILASPIWAGAVSTPMRGYMTLYKDKLVKTAIFLGNDSGNVENALAEIREILVDPPLVEGSLQRSKIKTDFDSTVEDFISRISSL